MLPQLMAYAPDRRMSADAGLRHRYCEQCYSMDTTCVVLASGRAGHLRLEASLALPSRAA